MVIPPHTEGMLDAGEMVQMSAVADTGLLLRGADGPPVLLKPQARQALAALVEGYHERHPDTPLSTSGRGVFGFPSKRRLHLEAIAARAAEELEAEQERGRAAQRAQDRLDREAQAQAAKDKKRASQKKAARVAGNTADEMRWEELEVAQVEATEADRESLAKSGLNALGWAVQEWPKDDEAESGEQMVWHTHTDAHLAHPQ